MSACSSLLVRPFAVGFPAGTLLLLAACSGSGPEPEVQARLEAPSLVTERVAIPPAAAAMPVEASRKRMATLAHAPAPIADILPPSYRDVSREQYQAYADNSVFSVAETPVSTFSELKRPRKFSGSSSPKFMIVPFLPAMIMVVSPTAT